MIVGALFTIVLLAVGYAVAAGLRIAHSCPGLACVPALGAATAIIVSVWLGLLRVPPPGPGVTLLCVAVLGAGLALRDFRHVRPGSTNLILFAMAMVAPCVITAFALADARVPLSPHDGATHTEMTAAFRAGLAQHTWYPPGLSALFGAVLQLVPALDTAQGAVDLGMGLPLLACVAVIGLGWSIWRSLTVGAAGALMLSLTYLYPYFPQIWSGWPLALSLVLVIGLWTVALEYVTQPTATWGIAAGLLVGAMLLLHGTELYTGLVVLLVVYACHWRAVPVRGLVGHVITGIAAAVLVSAIYLPTLVPWAAGGGATAAALNPTTTAPGPPSDVNAGGGLAVFAIDALGTDLPIRLVLVGIGVHWTIVRQRFSVPVVALIFLALTATFSFGAGSGILRALYAETFPWAMHYRLLMLVALAQALLAGAGGACVWRAVSALQSRPSRVWVHVLRASRVLFAAWLVVTVWGTAVLVRYSTDLVLGYAPDDDAAMAWLRANVRPGEIVANDGFADAGIWAPYKAGVGILTYRSAPDDPERLRVMENIARLDEDPVALAAACRLGVRYVYYGAKTSSWQARTFPPVPSLQRSPALSEVFAAGDAHVFAVNAC